MLSAVVEAYGNCEAIAVELEKNTPSVQMLDDVAAVVVPNVDAIEKPDEPPPVPEPQAAPVFVILPVASKVAHPGVPPADETIKLLVEAVANDEKSVEEE